jgi:hypothetical protein
MTERRRISGIALLLAALVAGVARGAGARGEPVPSSRTTPAAP